MIFYDMNIFLIVYLIVLILVKFYNFDFCFILLNKICWLSDNEYFIWVCSDKCVESYFQFILEVNGVLCYKCSGKMVCFQGSGNGVKIVVSSSCNVNNFKFYRIIGKKRDL